MGALHQKIRGEKHAKYDAILNDISKFGNEYLRNEWKDSKSNKYLVYPDSSRMQQKSPTNFGTLTTGV